jgi:predicted MFS family arabinose efflux permease
VLLLPLLYAPLGLTAAFLALPLAAAGLGVGVALRLPAIPETRPRSGSPFRGLLRDRDFWLLLVGVSFIGMLAQVAVMSWMPTYLRQVHGYGVVAAGITSAIVVAGLMVFSPIFGALSDRLTARRPVMLLGSGLALAAWLTLLVTDDPVVAIGAAFLVSASMAATIPMQVVYTSERFAAVGAGAAIGLVNSGGQVAASLGAPLYGLLLDRGLGFGAVWGTAAALGVLRIAALLLLREPPVAPGRPPAHDRG